MFRWIYSSLLQNVSLGHTHRVDEHLSECQVHLSMRYLSCVRVAIIVLNYPKGNAGLNICSATAYMIPMDPRIYDTFLFLIVFEKYLYNKIFSNNLVLGCPR